MDQEKNIEKIYTNVLNGINKIVMEAKEQLKKNKRAGLAAQEIAIVSS